MTRRLPPPAFLQPPQPRVALVHDWLTGMRGGEKVLAAFCAMFPDAPIFTLFHFPGSVSPEIESHPIHTSFLQNAPRLRKSYRSYLPLFPAAMEEFDLTGFDVIVSSSHCVAKGVIPGPDALHLCYCHTPMRYAWDQEHAYFPKRKGMGPRLRSFALSALRAWDASSASRVNIYVANSTFVARRIQTYYGREAEVAHPPVDVDFFTPGKKNGRNGKKNGKDGDYCLMVSALAPYKKVENAMAACEKLGMELRIVGEGPERKRLAGMAGSGIRFLGKVGAEKLQELYRGARLFLQPGVEDFGIASVEALACGTPVVAVARGGILDVVEDGRHGVLYPDWEGPTALAEAIDKALRMGFNPLDLRDRAESFSVSRFTDRIRSLLSSRIPS
ncbi:MAG TPA: glycosyltransferase [Thermoanaerobaculia bacterium]|nr:glycosyltransferase [Thermoanaerobaculia bacterium]